MKKARFSMSTPAAMRLAFMNKQAKMMITLRKIITKIKINRCPLHQQLIFNKCRQSRRGPNRSHPIIRIYSQIIYEANLPQCKRRTHATQRR